MFCRVIPVTRTPPGIEAFDYRIPEGMDLKVGDLIVAPFRRAKMPAMVMETRGTSPFASKAQNVIGTYADIRFPKEMVALLDYVASHTFTSKPAVLKAWLRSLPKKPHVIPAKAGIQRKHKAAVSAHWSVDHEAKLIERAKTAVADGIHVLILTPWKARLEMFLEKIGQGVALSSDDNDGDSFRAWQGFAMGASPVLIATRLGAWLSPLADLVLIDEPENDDHKQDEMAPRYDARKMAIWCAEHAGTDVEAYGLTPPLHSEEPAPTIEVDLDVVIRHPAGRSGVPMVQGEALNTLRDHEGKRIIIHPIKGELARLACRDCGYRAECTNCGFTLSAENHQAVCRRCGLKTEMPLECPKCGGPDLGKSLPGIERLKTAWKKFEPDTEVEWRGVSNADFEMPIPWGACVLVTDASLITGGSEDVRRMEKLAVGFRRLARTVALSKGRLIIQTDETLATRWTDWLTTEGFGRFREQERGLRTAFGYPPAKRLVKLIVDTEHPDWMTVLKGWGELRGPYPVPYRTKSQKKRYIWHLLPKQTVLEPGLMQVLTKNSSNALIDLDPIAFLR